MRTVLIQASRTDGTNRTNQTRGSPIFPIGRPIGGVKGHLPPDNIIHNTQPAVGITAAKINAAGICLRSNRWPKTSSIAAAAADQAPAPNPAILPEEPVE